MPGSLVARLASDDDAEAVTRIYNQGIDDRMATFETQPRVPHEVRAWLRAGIPAVVVEDGGRPVAWAAAHPYRPDRPVYRGVGEFSVYVDRDRRGTGAGRVALRALIDRCEDLGYWKLLARIFPENGASRALARSLGFREVGVYRRHARLDGAWRDCVIVERLLGPAVAPSGSQRR
jgi:L-amino acid N-acyltransferase YncA